MRPGARADATTLAGGPSPSSHWKHPTLPPTHHHAHCLQILSKMSRVLGVTLRKNPGKK